MSYKDKKFPGRRLEGDRLVFFWQCAYADASDTHCVLYGDVWDELRKYDRRDNCYKQKLYDSAHEAVMDMLEAWQRSGRGDDGLPPGGER